jgi:hypothetical protein
MLRLVALVRTDDSEERSASIITVTRIGELGTALAVTTNRSTLRRNTEWVPPKRRFLQEPRGVTSQKTPFFGVSLNPWVSPNNYQCPITAYSPVTAVIRQHVVISAIFGFGLSYMVRNTAGYKTRNLLAVHVDRSGKDASKWSLIQSSLRK